jgi:hypothetical protein
MFSGTLAVSEISGDLIIDGTTSLCDSLGCFDSLLTIHGNFAITNNNSLENVYFQNLQTIGGGITIEGNEFLYFDSGGPAIANLFPAISSVSGSLIRIWDNTNITNDQAQTFVDELTNGGFFSGSSEIGP